MRILITGSSGQIGANLALRLLADGHEVFGVQPIAVYGGSEKTLDFTYVDAGFREHRASHHEEDRPVVSEDREIGSKSYAPSCP